MDDNGFLQKGFQDTLQALFLIENLIGEKAKSIKVTFIGKGNKVKDFTKDLNKLKHVSYDFFESLPNTEVKEKTKESDVVLMPSRFEGMSMFATECLSLGKAFIFTNDGGMRDMIFDNVNGISIRPFDYVQMANAVMAFMKNKNMVADFSKASLDIFQDKFSDKAVLNLFDTFLETHTL